MFFDTENSGGSGATTEIIKDWFSIQTARSEQQITVPNLSEYKFIIIHTAAYANSDSERSNLIDLFSNMQGANPETSGSIAGGMLFVSYKKLKQKANTALKTLGSWGSNGAATIAYDYIKYVNDTTIKVYADQIGLRKWRIIGIK